MWSAQYRAYGQLAIAEVEEVTNPLRFQGQYHDVETGLYYNRHRYYDPKSGRFTTIDPIALAGGLNNYQYVKNPTGWIDPLGLQSVKEDGPNSCGGNNEYVYRGVKEGPDVILSEGFYPRGESGDLLLHARDNALPPSAFVSTSKSMEVATDFATGYGTRDGYLYTMRQPVDGIDVNSELGGSSPYQFEQEVAIQRPILPDEILGVTEVASDGKIGSLTILNPKIYGSVE